ncbi:hypothetical protein FJZ28_00660 [Candidatus Peregrinibacteria bacterium]|nr:hypothetical protein [Candidatus Peregrinibacteria bacterium]
MLRLITSLCLVLVVSSASAQSIPLPPFVPPAGTPTPAPAPAPAQAPLVVNGQRMFNFQAGGMTLKIGASGEKGYVDTSSLPVGFSSPIQANSLKELDRVLKAAEIMAYNDGVGRVHMTAHNAEAYFKANTNHYSRVHTTTDGEVRHVHSGTVTHRAEYDEPLCAQDRRCGSTFCGCGHQRNVYWSYQYNRRYYRCYNTGVRRWYGSF